MPFQYHKICVTGATGFIGGRLIERLLLEDRGSVRALIRDYSKAVRIARLPVEMILGDISNYNDVERFVKGCDVLIHCAYGNKGDNKVRKAVTVKGTENILKAAVKYNIKKVIHLSTMAVYGPDFQDGTDENTHYRRTGNLYGDSKIEAEKVVYWYYKKYDLPVVIIQPTIVFGPYSSQWTIQVVENIEHHRLVMVNSGTGTCHPLYIDDLVDAIFLAIERPEAIGHSFIISDKPITWAKFFSSYAEMIGNTEITSLSESEIRLLRKEQRRRSSLFFRFVMALQRRPELLEEINSLLLVRIFNNIRSLIIPKNISQKIRQKIFDDVIQWKETNNLDLSLHGNHQMALFKNKAYLNTSKAQNIIGFKPRIGFEKGMLLTEQWLRFSNLI